MVLNMLRDIKNHHRRFIAEFIEMYKSFPTLWNVKSSEYNDRDAKRAAYLELVGKLREVEPEADKQDVIRKINSLRSAFRREHRKVILMKSVGKIYKPRLWYFNLINFTVDENDKTNIQNDSEEHKIDIDILSLKNNEDNSLKEEEDDMFVEEFNTETGTSTVSSPHAAGGSSKIRPLHIAQDEYDAVGYNVASKLRNMERNQRIIAERIIAETLFQGQMGTLSINSSCSNFYPTMPAKDVDDDDIKFDPTSLV